MSKKEITKKEENTDIIVTQKEFSSDDEELAFIEYQENVSRSKEAKRNRTILIFLAIAIYLLGLGLFATIVQTIYQMNELAGIITGITLLVLYTTCFVFVIVGIFSKHSFDLEFKKRQNGHFSERVNNKVRFEIAQNIKEQTFILDYLEKQNSKEYITSKEDQKVQAFEKIIEIVNKNEKHIPSVHSPDAKELAENLSISFQKDGIIYKKAKSIIRRSSVSVGIQTALSQNTMIDVGIVAVKNMQLIKDLIWLYGFRPTNGQMNRILWKVIRNISTAFGLSQMPKSTTILSKMFNKNSNNFWVQLLGQVFSMSAQFVTNGLMTYMIGKYTVNVLLNEYRIQDLFRQKDLKDYQILVDKTTIDDINSSINSSIKNIKEQTTDDKEVMLIEEAQLKKIENEKKLPRQNIFEKIRIKFQNNKDEK